MAPTKLRLRPWQRRALDRYLAADTPDFLAVATPGAGKTTFALTAARMTLPQLSGRLIIVAPTRHLKEQWADAAERFGLMLDTDWSPADGLPADVHGVVTTYQQVGSAGAAFRPLAEGGFVVLDEIHHAGEDRAWGDGILLAFGPAARRIALSGTPFRSDTRSIPFVRYEWDEVVPDIEYGYGDALGDGRVVRPVYFPRFGGHMEWVAPDGAELSAAFDDDLTRTLANQRLRAALSLEGDWLPAVIANAHAQLEKIRAGRHHNAGGLVIAMDQEHAHGIADLLRKRHGVQATVAVSDDPNASAKISSFSAGSSEWIVAVRMVSEGVDIPRLRVAVYATTTTTELFFRQAVGRIVRWTVGAGQQRAYMFMPDDPRLRHFGNAIAEARRHLLRKRPDDDDPMGMEGDGSEPDAVTEPADEEQLSLFSVLSSTVGEADHSDDIFDEDDIDDTEGAEEDHVANDEGDLEIDLQALPPAGPVILVSRRDRERLRDQNAQLVKELVALTGKSHAVVNAELNRASGVHRVPTATAIQLSKRLKVGRELLAKEQKRRRMARFV